MNVVGLDLSLTATGVADEFGTRTIKVKSTGMKRLSELQSEIMLATGWPYHTDLVAIEGYSMGTARQNSHAHALGELGGVVRLALWEAGIPYVDVPPASLKRYATGKGNAGKAEVLIAAVKRLGYLGHDDNEADAAWLRAMALDHYGEPVVAMPASHRVALAAIAWPALAVRTEVAS